MKTLIQSKSYRIHFSDDTYLAFPITEKHADAFTTTNRKSAACFVVNDEYNGIEELQEQIKLIQTKTKMSFSIDVEEHITTSELISLDEFKEMKHEKVVRPQFTLNHLFDALSDSRETRADVREVRIKVENMIRLGQSNVDFDIETEELIHESRAWYELIESYYPYEKVRKGVTSTKELRGFFDDDMLEFFEEYRPVLLFNDEKLDIDTFLKENVELEIVENSDT